MPVDWVSLVAVFMGTLTILIPIAGLTARFALKPVVEAVATYRESDIARRDLELIEKRIAMLEQAQESLESEVERLTEVVEFHDRLEAPEGES